MRDFIQILKRFIPPYKSRLGKNIFYNILSAAFGSVSFVLLVPVLNILFNVTEEVTELVPFELNKESLMTNFNYYVTLSKQHFSASTTLLFAGGFFVLAALFKTGFSYLASYEIVFIRNGVVRDIRRKIYQKILSLPLPFFPKNARVTSSPVPQGDVQEVGELHHELVGNVLPEPHHHPDLPLRNDLHELATNPVRASTTAHHGNLDR